MPDDEEVNAEQTETPTENDNGIEPDVPADLLELHLELEDAGITPEQFKEAFGK